VIAANYLPGIDSEKAENGYPNCYQVKIHINLKYWKIREREK